MEEWKYIKTFEGKYQVSNYGRIKNIQTNHVLIPGLRANGYYQVTLWRKKYDRGNSYCSQISCGSIHS